VTSAATSQIDPEKLNAAIGKFLNDAGAAVSGVLIIIGDKLGFYKALARDGALTSAELAERTGTRERYVREWLANQAASGYLTYDSESKRFALPPEHIPLLADANSEVFMPPGFAMAQVLFADEPKISDAIRSGDGVGWDEHDQRLFAATYRFFRNGYAAHLVGEWIRALSGVDEKLRSGANVADIGCGFGASTVLMAKAYPASRFTGFDYHVPSVETAQNLARDEGVQDRASFRAATAKDFPGNYDLICYFDCLHDMGDPVGALVHARQMLAPDGTVMLVEPFAKDLLEDNLNPIGRLFYGASTLICVPASLKQEVGVALGAQSGEARMRTVAQEAGFSRFRIATQTPFNIIYEIRP
jgi:2-polyprenyl-3-methyl-5-hydroxy-6-metoxy-1,4-benzoquinol methylase